MPLSHAGAEDVRAKAAVTARMVLHDHQNHVLLVPKSQLRLLVLNDTHLNLHDTNFSARPSDIKRAATQP